ncbi:MAG: hypothetical protein KY444_12455 [Gemmatimonadetes bacterium]|nr:hypothetical protein [Gemmatimonadota bacterium]
MMIHTGYSGTELKLHWAAPDTLPGVATEHWDVGPPFSNPAGPVLLVRIPCVVEPDST